MLILSLTWPALLIVGTGESRYGVQNFNCQNNLPFQGLITEGMSAPGEGRKEINAPPLNSVDQKSFCYTSVGPDSIAPLMGVSFKIHVRHPDSVLGVNFYHCRLQQLQS